MESGQLPTRSLSPLPGRPEPQTNLADILERVLDKGIVIAGDIQINLLDIELLTIKLRLLIASVDRAREMGINWWEGDPSLQRLGSGESGGNQLEQENRELRERLDRLERQLGAGDGGERSGASKANKS
jgi:gas vesicle protein GvpA/GvpJ/GvpM family